MKIYQFLKLYRSLNATQQAEIHHYLQQQAPIIEHYAQRIAALSQIELDSVRKGAFLSPKELQEKETCIREMELCIDTLVAYSKWVNHGPVVTEPYSRLVQVAECYRSITLAIRKTAVYWDTHPSHLRAKQVDQLIETVKQEYTLLKTLIEREWFSRKECIQFAHNLLHDLSERCVVQERLESHLDGIGLEHLSYNDLLPRVSADIRWSTDQVLLELRLLEAVYAKIKSSKKEPINDPEVRLLAPLSFLGAEGLLENELPVPELRKAVLERLSNTVMKPRQAQIFLHQHPYIASQLKTFLAQEKRALVTHTLGYQALKEQTIGRLLFFKSTELSDIEEEQESVSLLRVV
jgi:hypothetical protein